MEFETNNEASERYKCREKILEKFGLDVNSCLQFLLDFYSQLLKQQVLTKVINSDICLPVKWFLANNSLENSPRDCKVDRDDIRPLYG